MAHELFDGIGSERNALLINLDFFGDSDGGHRSRQYGLGHGCRRRSFNLTLLGRIGHWSKCLEISGRQLGASNQSQRPVGSLSRLEELGGV